MQYFYYYLVKIFSNFHYDLNFDTLIIKKFQHSQAYKVF